MPNYSISALASLTELSWVQWKAINQNGATTLFRDKPVYREPGLWIARGPVDEQCAFGKVAAPFNAAVLLWPVEPPIAALC